MNVLDEDILSGLRKRLMERRREIIGRRREMDSAWQELSSPETEMEETAGKENLARGLEQLDRQGTEEVQRIDDALAKMDDGVYGTCEACRGTISVARLQAMPEARHCARCARLRESFSPGRIRAPAVSTRREELTDDEMRRAALDALAEDGTVETQELEIRCADGVVYLGGLLPSKRQHSVLRQIVDDALGFGETVDNITIDRQLWERRERNRTPERKKQAADVQMEGEDRVVDAATSRETGEPMTPPDHLKPENE
jgi:DnaK suppressor protein